MSESPRTEPPRRRGAAILAMLACLCLAGAVAASPLASSAAAAKPPACKRLGAAISLSKDPTELRDNPVISVTARGRSAIVKPRVVLRRAGKVFASGRISGRLARGQAVAIPVHLRKAPGAGRYKVQLSGRRAGCGHRATVSRKWRFTRPSLPLRAAPFSTKVGDNVGGVKLVLRPVARTRIGPVRVSLLNAAGGVVAEQGLAELDGNTVITLPLAAPLRPGRYRIRLTGQQSGSSRWQGVTQKVVFAQGGSWADPVIVTGAQTQRVQVDWYGGDWNGRELGGFVAPGIGYGEIVCTPDAQWIRFYPADQGREVSMMSWTYKDWGQYHEKALREALHTAGTGPDFREGFNKFGPSEKTSTGEFDGIITDRGPIGGGGGAALAPPTTFNLTWQWDFRRAKRSRCHVEATFRTETAQTDPPLARSAQVLWRGEGNAAGRTEDSVDFPGLGEVRLTCEPAGGVRRLLVDSPVGGRITTREASQDPSVPQGRGPILVNLPNNGMVVVEMDSGQRIVVSSRWKVNDPDGGANWCAVAAQVLSG